MEAILSPNRPIDNIQKLVLKEDESFHEAARRLSRNNISYRNHNTFSDPTHQTANRSKPFSIETQSRLGRARNSTFSRELFVCYREGGVLQSWKNRNTNLLPLPPSKESFPFLVASIAPPMRKANCT